jgi:hypothetical protein
LAIDLAKAFDSVNHDFMTDVYKFFGFGDMFIKMLTVFTTGRNAHILFDNGLQGKNFPLECGNAQGNPPSPLQFNLCEEILLIKIEYSKTVKSILNFRMDPPPGEEPNRAGDQEQDPQQENDQGNNPQNFKNDKVEAFVDDGTILGRLNQQALLGIVKILKDFAAISGLKCNMSKSSLLLLGFGENKPVPEWVGECGFQIANEIKILGCNVTKK